MLGGKFISHWPIDRRLRNLSIPDTWPDLPSFVDWYLSNHSPMTVPWNAQVLVLDDATTIPVFRHGSFQVELYLIHPGKTIPLHSHPGMEVVTMVLGGGGIAGGPHPVYGTGVDSGRCYLSGDGETHGGAQLTANTTGFALLTFERWLTEPPSSAALLWSGDTAGPLHHAALAGRRGQ